MLIFLFLLPYPSMCPLLIFLWSVLEQHNTPPVFAIEFKKLFLRVDLLSTQTRSRGVRKDRCKKQTNKQKIQRKTRWSNHKIPRNDVCVWIFRCVPNQPSDDEASFACQPSEALSFIPSHMDSSGRIFPRFLGLLEEETHRLRCQCLYI